MKTNLTAAVIYFLAINYSFGQMPNQEAATGADNVHYSFDQVGGYSFLGLGVGTIAFTAFNVYPGSVFTKYPAAAYTVGGALVATGLYLLICGDEADARTKYWQGMQGYVSPRFTPALTPILNPSVSCSLPGNLAQQRLILANQTLCYLQLSRSIQTPIVRWRATSAQKIVSE